MKNSDEMPEKYPPISDEYRNPLQRSDLARPVGEPTHWVTHSGSMHDAGDWTNDKDEAELWKHQGRVIRPLYASPQPEGETVEILIKKIPVGHRYQITGSEDVVSACIFVQDPELGPDWSGYGPNPAAAIKAALHKMEGKE